jgi:hypothetical protein
MERMQEHKRSPANHLRITSEFLFSLNIALLFVLVRSMVRVLPWQDTLQFRINGFFDLHPHSRVGAYGSVFGIAFVLALCIFLVLRLFSFIFVGDLFLRFVVGFVSVFALPVAWLDVSQSGGLPSYFPSPSHIWLLVELGATFVFISFYLLKKWVPLLWVAIAWLILHFSFWSWIFFDANFRIFLVPSRLIFPLVGFLSSVTWGLYVSKQHSYTAPPHTPPADLLSS